MHIYTSYHYGLCVASFIYNTWKLWEEFETQYFTNRPTNCQECLMIPVYPHTLIPVVRGIIIANKQDTYNSPVCFLHTKLLYILTSCSSLSWMSTDQGEVHLISGINRNGSSACMASTISNYNTQSTQISLTTTNTITKFETLCYNGFIYISPSQSLRLSITMVSSIFHHHIVWDSLLQWFHLYFTIT